MEFNYFKLFEDIQRTFVYGDKLNKKVKEIGIRYNSFTRLRMGKPISMEDLLKCGEYLAGGGVFNIGEFFESYIK